MTSFENAGDSPHQVVVVGGYGDVGSRVSARLAERLPGRVVIAGRTEARAQALADQVRGGCRAARMDIDDEGDVARVLSRASTVVTCLHDPERRVLMHAVQRGLRYVDITADRQVIEAGRGLHGHATASGARAVLGIGLAPGATNLIAADAAAAAGDAKEVVVGVLLSLYDEYGPQALDFMLEAASRRFPEAKTGALRLVVPYTQPRTLWFGPGVGRRRARWFPFPDQFAFRETLGVDSAATLISIEPAWIDRVFGFAATLRLLRVASYPGVRSALVRALMRVRGTGQPSRVRLCATAQGPSVRASVVLQGVGESDVTADIVTTAALAVGNVAPGVWLPEQAFDPRAFLQDLTSEAAVTISRRATPPRCQRSP